MNKEKLGTENIGKLLASLAIPAVVAQIVNLLYNIVDRIYIGHIPGIGAAALNVFGFFKQFLCILKGSQWFGGCAVEPRHLFSLGQKKMRKLKKSLETAFLSH